MPIKNYTTSIDVYKTIGEIQGILVRHGARRILQEYDASGRPVTVCFEILTALGVRQVRLPSKTDAVLKVLVKQKVKCDTEQGERVAWRIVKDWIDAQFHRRISWRGFALRWIVRRIIC